MAIYTESVVSVPIPASPVPILIWGQSNATGQGTTAPTGTPITSVPYWKEVLGASVHQTRRFSALDWIGLRHGIEVQLAKDLVTAGRNPVIAQHGRNATAIANWVPSASAPDWPAFRDHAAATLNRVSAAIKRHVIVIHGETDGGGSSTANAYGANLATLASQMRSIIGSCRFYVLRLNVAAVSVTFNSTIRTQQANFVSGDIDAELIDTDGVALAADPHYDSAGYNALGSLVAAQIVLQT